MLWAISAVTTPLALGIYLCTTERGDLLPLNYDNTHKFLLYMLNILPLLFATLAFLFGARLLMLCALALIIFFYVVLYATRVPRFTATFWQHRHVSKKLLPKMEYVVVGSLVALMVLSAVNAVVMAW